MNPVMMALMPWVRQGYCCGQLLILLMLQAMERENPDLVCAAGGLCHEAFLGKIRSFSLY